METKQKNNLFLAFKNGLFCRFVLILPVFLLVFSLNGWGLLLNTANAASPSPVYQFQNSINNNNFYTISASEKDAIMAGAPGNNWNYQGIAFNAASTQENGLVPFYRFWDKKYKVHYFTISENEKNKLTSKKNKKGWRFEGVAFYVYTAEAQNLTPVYRFYKSANRAYLYTTSPGEKNCLVNNYSKGGWKYAGIAFWVAQTGADLSTDDTLCDASYGPEITVGLWSYSKNDLQDNPFKITANKNYNVKDKSGKIIAVIPAGTQTKVTYTSDNKYKIYNSIASLNLDKEVSFDSVDGKNTDIIFNIYQPSSVYDQYRGKIKLRYSDDSKKIWVINALPLEQYIWGDGEITGTGDTEYNKVMAAIYRTYGKWKIENSTKYATEGFKVTDDSGSQIYRGYDWEKGHLTIKAAAQSTRGQVVKYDGDVALTPYSSWTDGRTRSFEERWGSKDYPWCQSVKDPYGKNPSMSTKQLEAAGNHMVGLSAHGALHLASEHNWDWQKILNYYFDGIKISSIY